MGWGATDWIAVATCAQVGVLGAAALYARGAVNEARRLRSSQTRPYVVVYADTNKAARFLIDLVVENIGQTPARDISIRFDPKLESSMERQPGEDRVNDWVALSEGIPYLAPGQRMTHLLDSSISRYAEGSTLPRQYRVTVTYSEVGPRPAGQPHSEEYVIDLGVWYGSHYTEEYGIHAVGQALIEIGKTVSRWTENIDGLRVYNVDLEKYEGRTRAAYEEIIARQREASQSQQETEGGAEPPDLADPSVE
jgi:hypothetical protein